MLIKFKSSNFMPKKFLKSSNSLPSIDIPKGLKFDDVPESREKYESLFLIFG